MEKITMEKKEILIPNDIVIEIFSRLPAKSLVRFRWACKYWFDLITRDDDFLKMHLHRSTTTTTIDYQNINNKSLLLISRTPSHVVSYSVNCSDFINNSSSPPETVQFDYCNLPAWIDHHTIRVEEEEDQYHHNHHRHVYFQSGGSCNGLIFLYSSCDICYDHSFLEYEYFLWNPSTRELKKLPPNKSSEHLRYSDQRSHFHGFGYDHTIDDYKVIDILILYYPLGDDDDDVYPEVNINIYTLGSNSWSTKMNTDQLSLGDFARINACSLNLCRRKSDGCFFNGALHWITKAEIISFDIVEEEFRVYPQLQPPNYSYGRPSFSKIRLSLEVLNGCLCVVVVTYTYSEAAVDEWMNTVELWMMKDYCVNESWTKVFTIDSVKLCNICDSWCLNQLKPIVLCKNGEILMVFNEQYLVLHDLKNEEHRWVHRIDNFQYVYVVESFIESLVSLKSGAPCI